MGKTHRQAALEATEEIGLAVMATTFTIVAVFVPGGVHGRHHRQVLLPVRHHRGGGGDGVALRVLHARPDALLGLARPAVALDAAPAAGVDPAAPAALHGLAAREVRPDPALGLRPGAPQALAAGRSPSRSAASGARRSATAASCCGWPSSRWSRPSAAGRGRGEERVRAADRRGLDQPSHPDAGRARRSPTRRRRPSRSRRRCASSPRSSACRRACGATPPGSRSSWCDKKQRTRRARSRWTTSSATA